MKANDHSQRGMLDVEELRAAVADGSVDTVILAFPDLYGRLMGKRLDASFFLTDVAGGTHACDYLFTVDMEMEPVRGYKFLELGTWLWGCSPGAGPGDDAEVVVAGQDGAGAM